MVNSPENNSSSPELPTALKLLWGRAEQSASRGPRRTLTIDRIASAATELADEGGFAAISMGAVAKRLGFTTMSLYRYVDTKDTLLALLADRTIGAPPTVDTRHGWRPALEEWAVSELNAICAHPWWLDIPPAARMAGPNTMSWLEAGLACLADVPIAEPVKLQLVSNLSLYVMSRGRLVVQMIDASDTPGNHQQAIAQLLEPKHYPALTSALAANAFVAISGERWELSDFRFGLARLLDGYAVFIAELADAL